MKKILVLLNAVRFNRGSEALARGTAELCAKAAPGCALALSSSEPGFAQAANYPHYSQYVGRYDRNKTGKLARYFFGGLNALHMESLSMRLRAGELLSFAKDLDLIVVVGGDNYDHSYKMGRKLNVLCKLLKENSHAKLVLYDCSFNKEDLTPEIAGQFSLFDAITVRESVTEQTLREYLPQERFSLFPDPAFVMPAEETPLPNGFLPGNTLGLNLSDLILRTAYTSDAGAVLAAYGKLITHVLQETDMAVALIPHVMKGADLSVLRQLYAPFTGNPRVLLLEDENLSAPRLKYIISQCRMFIGARTHATIAAYSSGVPTVVIGYSVKSIGIATDLFGTHEHYVLPVGDIRSDEDAVRAYRWLEEHAGAMKARLAEVLPGYTARAWETADFLRALLGPDSGSPA